MSTDFTAGDASIEASIAGGNDGAMTLRVGPAGSKVSAVSIAATGVATFIAPPVIAGVRQLAQIQTNASGALSTGTTILPWDDTIPQSTEGDLYLSLTITPSNVASTLEVDVVINAAPNVASYLTVALFQDSAVNALAAAYSNPQLVSDHKQLRLSFLVAAGTTAPTTFKVRAGMDRAGTTTVNGQASARALGGVMASRITIKEYLP